MGGLHACEDCGCGKDGERSVVALDWHEWCLGKGGGGHGNEESMMLFACGFSEQTCTSITWPRLFLYYNWRFLLNGVIECGFGRIFRLPS